MSINLIGLDEAAALVADGDLVGIAGNMDMAPMALARALARRGAKNLRLVAVPTGGINVDLLVGAGAVASVEFAQVSFGEHGLAPNFRRRVEDGRVATLDHTWPALLAGLQAGVEGVPFAPVRGVIGTDYLAVRPDFKVMRNPYGEDDVVIVPAIVPDVGIFHAYRADREGNVIADLNQNNWLLAQAAEKVIVTVEEVVEVGDLVRETFHSVITNIHVDAIVLAPRGAHPTGCRGYYGRDGAHIREYLRCARDDASFAAYLDRHVREGEARYLELVGLLAAEGGRA